MIKTKKELKDKLKALKSLKARSTTKKERVKYNNLIFKAQREWEATGRVTCRVIKGKLREKSPSNMTKMANISMGRTKFERVKI